MDNLKQIVTRKDKKKRASSVVLTLALVLAVFSAGYFWGQNTAAKSFLKDATNIINTEVGKPEAVDFSIFWEAWNNLKSNYVTELDNQELIYGAISGMTYATKDPHTVFLRPEDKQRFQDDIAGVFDGIGIEITLLNGIPTVVAPLSDSPAEAAGLKAKDIIYEVNGVKTEELGFEATVDNIRGEKGTTVKLTIIRGRGSDPFEIEVVRETITVASVSYELQTFKGKKYGYVKVRQFGDDTLNLFSDVVSKIVDDNPNGIIIDLRNNPGGYLDTAIDITSLLIDGGVVVSEVGKTGGQKDYKTTQKATLEDYKLAILVNEGSASASEILAGAIKDRGRGLIVGQTTFGKGSVQGFQTLSDGSAIKITVARWLTPNGTNIDSEGIEPDHQVEDDKDTEDDEVIIKAKELLSDWL